MRQACRHKGLMAAALVSIALASDASAQWTAFLPRPLENHAFFETYAAYERDRATGSARAITWQDTFLREKLTVESEGYSYNPRFILYRMSVGGAFKQELYENSAYSTRGWSIDEGIEYDARIYVLPEHSYNMQVFASRYEPVYRQQSARSHDSVANDYGVKLRYRRKPWLFDAGFLNTQLESSGTDSDIKLLTLDGEYFKRFVNGNEFSLRTAVRPSWYSDSNGLDGTAQEYLASNFINLKRLRLNSDVTQNSFEQTRKEFSDYETDQFSVRELMSIYLPWNFRTNLTWRLHDDSSVVDDDGPRPKRRFSDKGNNVQLDVVHRLYESLDTRYRFQRDSRDSRGGDSIMMTNGMNMDYTKQIPRGRFLAGVSVARSDIENSGFGDIVNDPYTATAVPGTFTLRQRDVDPTSIIVVLRSPIPPFENISLVEGVHYQVNTLLDPFEVQITNLPAEFVVPGSYDLYVSYSLRSGDYELRIDTAGSTVSLEMFRNLLTPYFRYLAQRSDLLSGSYPGVPIDSDSYTAGLRILYGPLRARGEYQLLDWDLNPYRAWRAELQYVGELTRSINAYATANYLNRHYLGADPPYTSRNFTEQVVTISATVTKQLYWRSLSLSAGGSYSHLTGLTESDAWSANSSIIWRYGKLDVSVGLSAYGSNSTSGVSSSAERDHQLFSITLRRQLL